MRSAEPAPERAPVYIGFALMVQILWLLHATTRDLSKLGSFQLRTPWLVEALHGPLGWALVAVLAGLGFDAVRRLRVAPAYALAVHAATTGVLFSLFTWQMEATVFAMAASMNEPFAEVIPAGAPSHDECAGWLRHRNALLASESSYEGTEPSEFAILDCQQQRSIEELACGLQSRTTEDMLECADRFEHSTIL